MPSPSLLQLRVTTDEQMRVLSGAYTAAAAAASAAAPVNSGAPPTMASAPTAAVQRSCIPAALEPQFARYRAYELIPYDEQEQCRDTMRDHVLTIDGVRTVARQVAHGDQYEAVDKDERGRAMPHATVRFATGKRNTSLLAVDLFVFELPVAYEVVGVVRREYAKRDGGVQVLVRVAYVRRVVAALRGHVVRRNRNQYEPRDILLLKTIQQMTGDAASNGGGPVGGGAASASLAASASRWSVLELVMRIVDAPGDTDRARVQAMMAAADELYVDVRVREQEAPSRDVHRIFFHGRADGTIARDTAPPTLHRAMRASAAAAAAA